MLRRGVAAGYLFAASSSRRRFGLNTIEVGRSCNGPLPLVAPNFSKTAYTGPSTASTPVLPHVQALQAPANIVSAEGFATRPRRDCAATTSPSRPRLRSAYSPIAAAIHRRRISSTARTPTPRESPKPPAMCCSSHLHAPDRRSDRRGPRPPRHPPPHRGGVRGEPPPRRTPREHHGDLRGDPRGDPVSGDRRTPVRRPTAMNPHAPSRPTHTSQQNRLHALGPGAAATTAVPRGTPPACEPAARPRAPRAPPRRDSIAWCPFRRSRPNHPVRPG